MRPPDDRDPGDRPAQWSRRRFVQFAALATATGAALLGIGSWLGRDSGERTRGAGARPTDPLSVPDLAEVSALAEVIFPPESEQEARELASAIRWWAEGRTARGSYLDVYREGLRSLADATRAAGHRVPFSELATADRSRIVDALLATPAEPGPFHALTSELAHGIYASAPGWHSLGYTTWPGAPSPPLEYTRPPARLSGLTFAGTHPGGSR